MTCLLTRSFFRYRDRQQRECTMASTLTECQGDIPEEIMLAWQEHHDAPDTTAIQPVITVEHYDDGGRCKRITVDLTDWTTKPRMGVGGSK